VEAYTEGNLMQLRTVILPILLGLAVFDSSAWGHDRHTAYAEWMKSLMRPDYPLTSCCGPGDQYYVREYRPSAKQGVAFEAIVVGRLGYGDFLMDVPNEKVIWDRVNPTGRGIIFIGRGEWDLVVLCFVPAIGT
jgi:hypothetical protein